MRLLMRDRRGVKRLVLMCVALCSAGCGESAKVHYAKAVCREAADTGIVPTAIRTYVQDLNPTPQRFLYIPGTDSTPPDVAVAALQDGGHTYMYSAVPAQQAPVKAQLHSVGDYPSLLLWWHGVTKAEDGVHATVTLSGQYVGEAEDGKATPLVHVQVVCDSSGWHAAEPAKGATKPATVAGT
jgi:hypothetical protein